MGKHLTKLEPVKNESFLKHSVNKNYNLKEDAEH